MTKKFAIVLALFLIAVVCSAGCIDPETPVDPVVPADPIVPVDPVTPVEPELPVEEYSVMFMLNYDDAGAYTAETVKAGDTVSRPASPSRSGYTFTGWFTAADGGVAYDFTQAVNSDMMLYAQWSKKKSSSSGGSSHSHDWDVVTEPATCVSAGLKTYTCSCGQTKTETIQAGHRNPETTGDGALKCPVCQEMIKAKLSSESDTLPSDNVLPYYINIEDAINNVTTEWNKIHLMADMGSRITLAKEVIISANNHKVNLSYTDESHIKILKENTGDIDVTLNGEPVDLVAIDDSEFLVICDRWDGTVDSAWYDEDEDELVIETAEALAGFAQLVNTGDTFEGKTVTLSENIDLASEEWTPIGTETNRFKGTFDGQEHTIVNMKIDVDSDVNQFVGLFGAVQNAVIKNLTIKDTDIDVTGAKVRSAAVVGLASSDTSQPSVLALNFENIKVEGCTITTEAASGSAMAGGIVGYCYPANMKGISVSDLTINGEATGNTLYAAAIAGYVCGQNINNNGGTRMAFSCEDFSVSNVEINAEAYTVLAGGYTGEPYYGYITIKDGTIDGLKMDVDAHEAFVGGLVGYFWRSDNGHNVNNVEITGIDFDVTTDYLGETRVGGMVGTSQSVVTYVDSSVAGKIIERCSDSENPVNYHAKVGGFVGRAYTWAQTYTNCIADVDVIGSHVAGGFVGNHITNAQYTNCEAKGDVKANISGGFAGRLTEHGVSTAVTFDGCKTSGNVEGTSVAGGFIGSTADHGWAAWVEGNGNGYGKTITLKNCEVTGTATCGTKYCAEFVGEVKMKDGVEINTVSTITP